MTTTADTPLQRAAKVIKDADKLWLASDPTTPEHYDEFVARAALAAALQVRWESVDSRTYQWAAFYWPSVCRSRLS